MKRTHRNISAKSAFPMLALVTACATGTPGSGGEVAAQVPPVTRSGSANDSLDANFVPPGFGTLRMDDITVSIALPGGLQVRAMPLDERVVRLLSPDSYNLAKQIKSSRQAWIDSVRSREHLPNVSLWYVTFYGIEQGEARFSPLQFIVTNVGRDFRPKDVLPLTAGFGDHRVKQREVQRGLYVFDGQLDINQPLTATMENIPSSTDWTSVLHRVEQERSAVRARASAAKKPTDD